MRFLADMGVSHRTVHWLRASGHDVAHVAELGMKTATDEDVLTLAAHENRVRLTLTIR